MIELLKSLKDLIIIVIPCIIGFIASFASAIKSNGLKKLAITSLKINEVIKELIIEAEKFINYSGVEKKEWVTTKTNQYCIENKMNYRIINTDSIIENLIRVSKEVNKREETKELL